MKVVNTTIMKKRARMGVPKLMGAREILGWLFVGFTLGFFIGCILGYRVGLYKGNGGE